jgi:hypothetical protein
MKQGFWYEYAINKILTTDSFRQNPNAIGFHNDGGRVDIPIAERYYKDNKRVGACKFYVSNTETLAEPSPNNNTLNNENSYFTDVFFKHSIRAKLKICECFYWD